MNIIHTQDIPKIYTKNTIKNNCGQNKHHTKVVVLKFYIPYHTKVVAPSENILYTHMNIIHTRQTRIIFAANKLKQNTCTQLKTYAHTMQTHMKTIAHTMQTHVNSENK